MLPCSKLIRIAWFAATWVAFHYTLYWRLGEVAEGRDTSEYFTMLTGLNILICVLLDVILIGIVGAVTYVLVTGEPLSAPTQVPLQRLRSGTIS